MERVGSMMLVLSPVVSKVYLIDHVALNLLQFQPRIQD